MNECHMNFSKDHLAFLLLSIMLFGCNENTRRTVSSAQQPAQAILQDSLQKLDSLAMKYRAKNDTVSLNYARQSGKLALAINTPEAKVKACNILGGAYALVNKDSGFYFYNKAMALADSFDLKDKKGKILYDLGMLHRSAGNFRDHLILIDSALRVSASVGDFATMSNAFNALGNFSVVTGDKVHARKMFDSAFAVANRNLLYLQMGASLGNLARFEPDSKKSVALQRKAISYLKRCNGSEEPIALNLINIGYRCTDVDSAVYYFGQAVGMVSEAYAPEVVIGAYNNLAYCYLGKGDLAKAENCIVAHALPLALKTNNSDWLSTVYDTYGDILNRKGNASGASDYKKKSVEAKKQFQSSVSTSLPLLKRN
jgi:tetratricopeptide (TPR) repeat protein